MAGTLEISTASTLTILIWETTVPCWKRPHYLPSPSLPDLVPDPGSLVPATPITPAGASGGAHDLSDISSFAAGTAQGSDEDMLSSLATDIKHVTKEKNVSLLRELKDFKAPATDIEKELSEISEQLNNAAGKGAKKQSQASQGMK